MYKSDKPWNMKETVGLYITLDAVDDVQFNYEMDMVSPYRIQMNIHLPRGKQELWARGIYKIICRVEAGMLWPLHFDYNNLCQYISLERLGWIEKKMKCVSFRVYSVPGGEEENGFDKETLRQWRNAAQRAAYRMRVTAATALDVQPV